MIDRNVLTKSAVSLKSSFSALRLSSAKLFFKSPAAAKVQRKYQVNF